MALEDTMPAVVQGLDPSRPRRALVVRGGWDGHQPVEATDVFIPFLAEHGFAVEVDDSPAPYADADYHGGHGPHCAVHDDEYDRERTSSKGLQHGGRAAGTGLAGWHGGITDSYRNSSDYLHLIGGQFACHPGKHPVRADRRAVRQLRAVPDRHAAGRRRAPDHRRASTTSTWSPSSTGCSPTTTSTCSPPRRNRSARGTPGTAPSPRRRSGPAQWGQGRIFVCTRGHRVDILRVPQVNTMIKRGLLWASRRGSRWSAAEASPRSTRTAWEACRTSRRKM